MRALAFITNLFPLWVLTAGILAMFYPAWFTWFGPYIVPGLAIIMLGMGITLTVQDFKDVLKMPKAVAVGFIAHYLIMPALGYFIAKWMKLPPDFAVGLILVSCCPSGTASNVVNYLAGSHVPLAVLITMCSTFGAIVFTPLLTKWLAGAYVPVDGWGLFVSTIQIVLLPLLGGLIIHHYFPKVVKKILHVSPLISVITIALICGSIIGQQAAAILQSGLKLLAAVFMLHTFGFLFGYYFTWLFGYDKIVRRTVCIEVGMQNSGLGAALARQHFPLNPLTQAPCAISSVFHSVIGSCLAGIWRLLK